MALPININELHLTEGRSTGIPTIIKALKKNQSPSPDFETDLERTYFKSSFHIHSYFQKTLDTESRTNLGQKEHAKSTQVPRKFHASTTQVEVLRFCINPRSRIEIHNKLQMRNRKYVQSEILKPLLDQDLISLTIPDKPNSPKQKYVITERGKKLLGLITEI